MEDSQSTQCLQQMAPLFKKGEKKPTHTKARVEKVRPIVSSVHVLAHEHLCRIITHNFTCFVYTVLLSLIINEIVNKTSCNKLQDLPLHKNVL